MSCFYGTFRAVRNVDINVAKNAITALIGPSGCGKSTLIRTINRMNDLIPSYRSEGRILLDGQDLFAKSVDPVAVRRRVGMVFQKPNPFPKSVYDNIAFGPRINGYKGNMDELVEGSLRRAALWDDVKDKLKQSGMALSGGQQQRLCIARTIAVESGGHSHGRAVLGTRSALDPPDRGPHGRAQADVHDRDRHPQHAAGCPGRQTRPCS